ncbi:MAG: DnaD domain protein [Bacilli bacterium]|nr:DnaD domain protein [Bacilli bacterium]
MKNDNLVELLKTGNVVIPIYLLRNYKKLGINIDEFVFLMYLDSLKDRIFDPKSISDDLDIKNTEVMNYIGILSDKKLVSIDTKKVDKNIIDIINLDGFYSKLGGIVKDKVNSKDVDNSNVYELIEKEFGRTLSSMEYEIIKAWLNNNISEELIREALKEAVFNGVSNLRYIDKILYEWGKLGIKTKEDVEKNRKKHNSKKNKEKVDIDIDWNWFDEGED